MKLMKALRYLFLSICIFLVSPAVGQTDGCGELKISAPDYLDPWDSRNFTVKTVMGEALAADWTLVKENYRTNRVEVETIRQKNSVKPELWNANDSGIVTAIATATSASGCAMTAAIHVMVVERVGSPLIIDEYGRMPLNDERGRLDAEIAYMDKRPKHNLLVYLSFRPTDRPATRRLRITQIFDHVVNFRKFDAKRLLFLISTTDRTYVKLEAASSVKTESIASIFPELLIVRAHQFADYKKLFQ